MIDKSGMYTGRISTGMMYLGTTARRPSQRRRTRLLETAHMKNGKYKKERLHTKSWMIGGLEASTDEWEGIKRVGRISYVMDRDKNRWNGTG